MNAHRKALVGNKFLYHSKQAPKLPIDETNMQFINNGPDIPNALLHAHEEGRVVFFCGAGISYPAGLPGFQGLVKQIYQRLARELSGIEHETFKRKQFDVTLDLLERDFPGQRQAVRRVLAQVLKPKLHREGATDTQAALLRLARTRAGELRLVTTNFDRLFHIAAKCTGQNFQTYCAPHLPIPKNSRWDGLVFLHGLLPHKVNDTALNHLVVTSGDFGLAYLIERWAARFVGELFRNYVVCFVGYSINDPMLRYMMDALAADRMLGEAPLQAWALGDCEPGQEKQKTIEWEAKGVTPILYQVPTGSNNHNALHHTLHAWAATYRDGVQGKEAIVVKHALIHPQNSTRQDDFVGQMLWALSDKSGLPARRFADLNPPPPLDWLEALEDKRFGHSDLLRFGVAPNSTVDDTLRFSLLQRPVSYQQAPLMGLVSNSFMDQQWDDVMHHLARWLTRHLGDPRLLIWIVERGGQLHGNWHGLIEDMLGEFNSLERDGNTAQLDKIRAHAPKAIPDSFMRTLWRLLLNGQVKSSQYGGNLREWTGRLEQDGLSTSLRLQLRELLAPKLILKKVFRQSDEDACKPVHYELVLTAKHVRADLCRLTGPYWKQALPLLLEDVQRLLCDALDLLRELDNSNKYSDQSYLFLPSISPHWQNRKLPDWVGLIELLRDAWLAVYSHNSARATRIAQDWFALPYPTFKRLALFAASQDNCIPADQWVEWLLFDEMRWLWSPDTRREVCRLLVLQGQHLAGAAHESLEAAILAGPPCKMLSGNLTTERREERVIDLVWLRLAKLKESGLTLGAVATTHFVEIPQRYPQLQLAVSERDEFDFWTTRTGDPAYEDNRNIDLTPRKRGELAQWLKKQKPNANFFHQDTWSDVCRTRFFHCVCALSDLANEGLWPIDRWSEALWIWLDRNMLMRSWRYAAPVIQRMPDAHLQEVSDVLTVWLESVSESNFCNEDILRKLSCRMLALPLDASSGTHRIRDGIAIDDSLLSATNHPIGRITQALINLWFKQEQNDNDLLPEELKRIFTTLCDVRVERFRHGRVLLASHLLVFFRVDRTWAEQHLLPLFDWSQSIEAKAVWVGFLSSVRAHSPLLLALKAQFLECVNHYADLEEYCQSFVSILTYAALERVEGYTIKDFRSAFSLLPQEGLEASTQTLCWALESATNQYEDYWKNRIDRFWQQIWPKSLSLISPQIAQYLALLSIAAQGEFPAALARVKDWLRPIDEPDEVIDRLAKSGLCAKFPNDALQLLSLIIDDPFRGPRKLSQCLVEATRAKPELAKDTHYMKLQEYCRRRGIWR